MNLAAKISDILPYYETPNRDLWQGRPATSLDYNYQIIQLSDFSKNLLPQFIPNSTTPFAIAFIGFAVDVGVKRNYGRVGAYLGPTAWRQQFARLSSIPQLSLYDVGNIVVIDNDLAAAQHALATVITYLLAANYHPIIIGGGHEVAFGTYQGIADFLKLNQNPPLGIINFDAHLDMRPLLPDDMGSSGTSFRQIAEVRHSQQLNFDYYAIGLQSAANPPSLVKYAEKQKVKMVYANVLMDQKTLQKTKGEVKTFCEKFSAIYASFCLDVLAEPWAPGVSAPQPLGLTPEMVWPLIKTVAAFPQLLAFEIAELSPPYDTGNRTAKMAAQIVHHYLHWRYKGKDS